MRLIPLERNEASEREITDAFQKTDSELIFRMRANGVCPGCAKAAIFLIRTPPKPDTGANPMGVPVCSDRCASGIVAALTATPQ